MLEYIEKTLVETEYIKMWIKDGIFHSEYSPDLVITLDIAKKMVEDRLLYCDGVSYCGLVDLRNLKWASIDAMKYLASKEAYKLTSRVALYSDNYMSKIISNFWFKLDKPCKPTRYFTDLGSAYLFLKKIAVN